MTHHLLDASASVDLLLEPARGLALQTDGPRSDHDWTTKWDPLAIAGWGLQTSPSVLLNCGYRSVSITADAVSDTAEERGRGM